MKLRKPLPPNRTLEQLWNHYLVEKAIAERLKAAGPEGRRSIYATMYDELFDHVPDHPRLTQRIDEKLSRQANAAKLTLLAGYLKRSSVVIEFAPGDCKFAMEMAKHVAHVYAIDISDQRVAGDVMPANCELIVYDGCDVNHIKPGSIDVVFSYNLIEHLFEDDTRRHFDLVLRLLKSSGMYVFKTPHAFVGPTDVSGYFADEPEGFHLKEWTFGELRHLLLELGYGQLRAYRQVKSVSVRVPWCWYDAWEYLLRVMPRSYSRRLTPYVVPEIYIVAVK
jgi:2-polyprenyl-3-methyl-5-hydroxy-6-metoxy-1,4-benzoquinol methylase